MVINLYEVEQNLSNDILQLCNQFSKSNGLMMEEKMYTFLAASILSTEIDTTDYLLEIGTYKGLTAVFMAKLINIIKKSNKVISIDPFQKLNNALVTGNYNSYMNNVINYNVQNQCLVISAFSHQAAEIIQGNIPFILIDGGHSYKVIKNDILLFLPKLKIGGIAYLHDNDEKRYPGVAKAISECIRGNTNYEILVDDFYFIVRRLA